ncbi:MAG: DUF3857 domain-containing protein, partial [Thioalkalispiraceae bacterium]
MKYLLVLLLVLPSVLQAKEKEFVELQSRITKMHYDYKLNDDFTVETLSEFEMKVLSDEMAKRIKKRSFSHSTSIEKLEVLEAYTLKANGKKIKVPKDNYQVTVNKGKAGAAAIFSDYTSISIVFPDLEKNDSVYYRLKRTEKKPMFPGHFSVSNFYYNQTAYDDVQVRFDLPESLEFKYQARQMKEKSY